MSLVSQLLFPENELLVLVIKFATPCKHIYVFTFFSGLAGWGGGGTPGNS